MRLFSRHGRRPPKDMPRGGIDCVMDASEAAVPDEEPDTGPEVQEAVPEGMDPELCRASRESRYEAERRTRLADQQRQTVFACACVVAGFCGIAGVIFGTAAVCSRMSSPTQVAVAGPPAISSAPADGYQDVYYDAGGQMHVNVYITREKDKDINVYVDADGNVTTETVDREDGTPGGQDATSQPGTDGNGADATQPADGQGEGGTTQQPVTDGTGEGEGEDATQGDGQEGGEEQQPPEGTGNGQQAAGTTDRTEAELLEEMRQRQQSGGSGFSETDAQYVVVYGDTLTKISHMCGFSVDFLAEYNHIANKNLIIVNEVIRYPSFGGGA